MGVEWAFRKLGDGTAEAPAPGELLVRPGETDHESPWGLTNLLLERGVEAFPRGPGPVERVVLPADPTFDDLLAATFALRLLAGQPLPPGAGPFGRYAGLAREGHRPSKLPAEETLEGVFLAIRIAGGEDLTEPETGNRFVKAWDRLAQRVLRAAEEGEDPFQVSLFAGSSDFARERLFLARDHEVYDQDVLRGERWLVRLPEGPPGKGGLLLRRPKSLLFKYWARSDPKAPGGPGYLFLAVSWGPGQWVFSTDPLHRLPLKGLADALQVAETKRASAPDPWFDGKRYGHTLVASPRDGSALSERGVLRVVRRWLGARALRLDGRRRWKLALACAALVLLVGLAWRPLLNLLRPPSTEQPSVNGERGMVRREEGQATTSVSRDLELRPGSNQPPPFPAQGLGSGSCPVLVWVTLRARGPLTLRAAVNDGKLVPLGLSPIAGEDAENNEVKSTLLEATFSSGENTIRLEIDNSSAEPLGATVTVNWCLNPSRKGDLYLLCVGVSKYREKKHNLSYADSDARALVEVFRGQQGALFRRVHVYKDGALVNEHASRENILEGLAWVREKAARGGLAVVSFSGHGDRDKKGNYYFLPHDLEEGKQLAAIGLDWRHIADYLVGAPCTSFIVLDTCHSGAALSGFRGPSEEAAIREAVEQFNKSERGTVVMAACLRKQLARERPEWGHGALTLALLEGLTGREWKDGKPAGPLKGRDQGRWVVSLKDLDYYVSRRVRDLTDRKQAVVTQARGDVALDLIPLAVARPAGPPKR
jgi:uncharacterized caspase-like protein